MKIHQAGKMIKGIQRCEFCEFILFEQKGKKSEFRIPDRLVHVKNHNTMPIVISSKGWKVGTKLKDHGRKLEVTEGQATCK